MSEALITKYRPTSLDDVCGQDAVVAALRGVLKKRTAQTFLFSGPPGTGKTTLARIVAHDLGCRPADLLEIDAATFTGIDDMRNVTASLNYRPLGEGSIKAVVVDECHALSKAAQQSLLKILEEPPAWVVWLLCTTEPQRLPEALRTRCAKFELKAVSTKVLTRLLTKVANEESLPESVDTDVLALCAENAEGSPRQALANLTICCAVSSYEEAEQLLRSSSAPAEAVQLARALVKGTSWAEAQKLLNRLQDANAESVRHVVRAYVSKVVLGARSEKEAGRALELLDAFSSPFPVADGHSPLILACGRVLLS